MRFRRVLIVVVAAAAAFGIASAVQASIPDASGILHACYANNNLHGYPPGNLRAIDTSAANGNCAQGEAPVDIATPQYVQNVVASTVNQTSFMIFGSATIFPAPNWVANYSCPPGYVATDTAIGAGDDTGASNDAITVHTLYNDEAANTFVPGPDAHLWFSSTGSPTITIHATCVDGRVFGQPGPAAPIGTAKSQANITLTRG